jgi:hypothetical protein
MTVNVKVIDANDNVPVFQSDYNISVKESFKVGDTILQLLATDKDIGENGRVFYRFSPQQSGLENIQQAFSLWRIVSVIFYSDCNKCLRPFRIGSMVAGIDIKSIKLSLTIIKFHLQSYFPCF